MFAPEGKAPLALLAVGAGVAYALGGVVPALVPGALALAVLALFREQARRVPALPLGVVSPCAGRVASVRATHDPWLDRDSERVGLIPRGLGFGVLCSPIEGKVVEYQRCTCLYRGEDFYSTPRHMAVSHALWIRTDEGDDVVLLVSARWRLHGWTCRVHVGERLGQGQRCGFGMFISRVDVLLPRPVRVSVAPRATVRAGSDLIATLRHRDA